MAPSLRCTQIYCSIVPIGSVCLIEILCNNSMPYAKESVVEYNLMQFMYSQSYTGCAKRLKA